MKTTFAILLSVGAMHAADMSICNLTGTDLNVTNYAKVYRLPVGQTVLALAPGVYGLHAVTTNLTAGGFEVGTNSARSYQLVAFADSGAVGVSIVEQESALSSFGLGLFVSILVGMTGAVLRYARKIGTTGGVEL